MRPRVKILFLIFYLAASAGFPQVTKIMGHVSDADSGEGIPFVNILVRGTNLGTLTDFDGNYAIEFRVPSDSLRATLLGYTPVTSKIQRNQFQVINFELKRESLDLPEVTIHYTGNPAEVIIRKVIANKEKNSIKSFNSYQYEAYTKIEIDANNISERFKDRKFVKPFEFIFTYVDTSTINGKSYLPVFITETLSDIYFRKSPRAKKEIIKASSISGIENSSVSQFVGNLSEQVDVYRENIPIFEKNFISPIADYGIQYYKYYLVDSAYLGDKWCYHIAFKPRRKQELTFSGNMWIVDTAFAVRNIDMRIAEDANVNFINDLTIHQEFEWSDDRFWMLTKDQLSIDFNLIENSKKTLGFFAHRTISYRNFIFDPPENKRFLSMPTNVFIEPEASNRPPEFWDEARHEDLSKKEKAIYEMVDSIKNVPIFKTYKDIVYTAVQGYLPWKKVELGPYSKLFSFNEIEGARFRIGLRTSNSFSKKIQLEPYVAYGTKDQTFKYGLEVIYMFNKLPRRDITVAFKYDLEQIGLSPTAFSTDNILTSIFSRGPSNKLTMVREFKANYEHEWFPGLSNRLWFIHRELFPLGGTVFVVYPEFNRDPVYMKNITTSEIRLDTRIAFRERYISGEFYRVTLSSYYPIVLFSFSYGLPNFINSSFEYTKLSVNVQQWFNFSTLGWSKYIIEAGKIWGTLPYPLLKNHDGNQTFLFDEYTSNLMNYYEFVSDQYFSVYLTHHFDGLLFNHLPLIRKLKWREVAHVRCVYGTLTDKNKLYSLFPGTMRPFNNIPYWEAGAGIENIFKIARIDFIWRLTHKEDILNPDVPDFGILVSLFFQF